MASAEAVGGWGVTSKGQMTAVIVAAAMMVGGLGLAEWLTPHKMLADELPALDLAQAVPASFGTWRLDPDLVPVLPDPTVESKLQQFYSRTLARTYVRADGARVMLTVAYGRNQNSASTAAHRPEFCYTGQGFVVSKVGKEFLPVLDHRLEVVQLMANAGPRHEPITYWVTLGQSASVPGLSRKLAQLKYGLQGWIMDGMLMRVSSLTPTTGADDQAAARVLHAAFISDLAKAMRPEDRDRFFGSKEE
ncbi:exosortase-associated protein EpsI, B-type [Aquabacterium sp.]|uniref:exosortase-associated protein EpsI, B-type n=1 Tax=Aquabacterium sp. TaxID=1872578 RepID=UPI0035B3AD26